MRGRIMMKKIYYCKVLLFILFVTIAVPSESVFAQINDDIDHGVEGEATITYQFDSSETEDAKGWIADSLNKGEEYIQEQIAKTDDPDKLEILNKALQASRNVNVNDMFKENEDGSSEVKVPLPNAQVTIDGKTVTTDQNGKYTIDGVDSGNQKIELTFDNEEIAQKNLNIQDGVSDIDANVNTTVTTDDLENAAKDMSESMAATQSLRYYETYKVGTKLEYKNESMQIVASKNVVSCNEISKNSDKTRKIKDHLSKTDFSKFPLNNSDCAQSIGLGVLASETPALAVVYHNSIYCEVEAAQAAGRRMGANTKNVYCDKKKKSGGHYNCSWFNGIGHSERLHTHN